MLAEHYTLMQRVVVMLPVSADMRALLLVFNGGNGNLRRLR